jgi:hypothetical protein
VTIFPIGCSPVQVIAALELRAACRSNLAAQLFRIGG